MPSQESYQRVQTTCLLVLTFIAAGVALWLVRSLLIPFVMAVFLLIMLSPVINWQVSHLKLPRGVALVTTLLLGALVIVLMGGLIASSAQDLSAHGDEYGSRLMDVGKWASGVLEKLGKDPGVITRNITAKLPGMVKEGIGGALDGLISVASSSALVLIYLGFLLAGSMATASAGTWRLVQQEVQKYLGVKIAVSLLTGVLVYVILRLCNVPLALIWAMFAFLLNFIPNVGSIVAILLPIPLILLSPEVKMPLVAIAAPAVIQFLIGNVVEPKFMGKSLGLHPVTILMGLIFWGMLWGFVGMLLSVPLTLAVRILCAQSEFTRPLAAAMEGRFENADGADAAG